MIKTHSMITMIILIMIVIIVILIISVTIIVLNYVLPMTLSYRVYVICVC